jgi:short-subunit dehydrogenase
MTVAITGAARGIGRATAEAFVREGRKVAIGDVDVEEARRVAAELGDSVIALPLDVRDRESFESFLDDAERELGRLKVLVNNAGIMSVGSFLEEDDATAQRMVDVNATGVLLGTKLAAERMKRHGGGNIVNVASAAGRTGFAGGVTYCATKFFVVGLSEALHAELNGTEVHVSCVLPGVVDTELVTGLAIPSYVRATPPEGVAKTIVKVVRTRRFEVFVPRYMAPVSRLTGLFPRRMVEAAGRRVGAEKALFDADLAARHEYDERVNERSGGERSHQLD